MHPVVAIVMAVSFFVGASWLVMEQMDGGEWIMASLAAVLAFSLNTASKQELLLSIFNHRKYYQIRWIENMVGLLPFLLVLLSYQAYWFGLMLVPLATLMIFLPARSKVSLVIPTPFGRIPFEPIVGFRRWFIAIGLIYFVFVMGIRSENFNLAVVALPLLALLTMAFYYEPEEEQIVWNYRLGYKSFIRRKLVNSLVTYFLLSSAAVILLLVFHLDSLLVVLVVWFVGMVYLQLLILTKYTVYPNEIGISQAIYLAIALWLPVSLFYFFPAFNKQARTQLKGLLE